MIETPSGIGGDNVIQLGSAFGASRDDTDVNHNQSPRPNLPWSEHEKHAIAVLYQEGKRLGFFTDMKTGIDTDPASGDYIFTGESIDDIACENAHESRAPKTLLTLSKKEDEQGNALFIGHMPEVKGSTNFHWTRQLSDFNDFMNGVRVDINALYDQQFAANKPPSFSIRGH